MGFSIRLIVSSILVMMLSHITHAQELTKLEVGFQDRQSIKGKSIYIELRDINDDSLPFKPLKIDIILTVSGSKHTPSKQVEILIEELLEPTELNNYKSVIKSKTWILHKVVARTNTALIINNKLTLRNVDYQTIGFYDSMLYTKLGFRIVALLYDEDSQKLQRIDREYLYSD